MIRTLYSITLYSLLPFQFFRLWQRGRKLPAYRQRWSERLGRIPRLSKKPRIWLHAVSVGEVNAAHPLIQTLLDEFPDHALLITTTTPTGSEQVTRSWGTRVEHYYFPYDLPHAIRRFLRRTSPSLLVVMETELWPNCFFLCARRHIPVLIANARISDHSYLGYRKYKRLLRPAIDNIDLVATQSKTDRDRFICLGVPRHRVLVTGNIKFDLPPFACNPATDPATASIASAGRPVWIAASTHTGEEQLVLQAQQLLLQTHPDALLILVPRHPERFTAVAALCQEQGFSVARRAQGDLPTPDTSVYLGDTMGELLKLYCVSPIAFLGGSLVPIGGHNPIEPASIGSVVISGPHHHNFRDVYQLMIEAQACRIVADVNSLAETLRELFSGAEKRAEMSHRAKRLVENSRGAVAEISQQIHSHLPPPNAKETDRE